MWPMAKAMGKGSKAKREPRKGRKKRLWRCSKGMGWNLIRALWIDERRLSPLAGLEMPARKQRFPTAAPWATIFRPYGPEEGAPTRLSQTAGGLS